MVIGPRAEHLLIDHSDGLFRLDLVEGTVFAGPVSLRFVLVDDADLQFKLATISKLRGDVRSGHGHQQLASRLLSLQSVDARNAGASLREVGDIVLGLGAWPGDGDHRKSLVRRMITAGERMIRAGPGGVMR